METLLITLAWILGPLAAIVTWRRLVPAPMPAWFDPINTWYRKRTFPPEMALDQFGVRPGCRVLEIGPASGYLTAAAADRVCPTGRVVALDIQHSLLQALRRRLGRGAPPLVRADASRLPFPDHSFDLVILAGVMGEIPRRREALREIRRVLLPRGSLAVAEELLLDPDYVRLPVWLRLAGEAGFEPRERFSRWFQYTQRFVVSGTRRDAGADRAQSASSAGRTPAPCPSAVPGSTPPSP